MRRFALAILALCSLSAVYTKSVPVKTNATGQIILNLHVADMAGNKLQTVAVEEINNTKPAGEYLKVVDGNVTGTVTLDRRQPTSGNDTAAPFIELIPSIEAIGVARETKLPLYNKSFSFALSVTDGPDNSLNAGLSSVDCELTYDIYIKKNTGRIKDIEEILKTDIDPNSKAVYQYRLAKLYFYDNNRDKAKYYLNEAKNNTSDSNAKKKIDSILTETGNTYDKRTFI